MRTLISAMAIAMCAVANAQTDANTPARPPAAMAAQDTSLHRSVYNECLLVAGSYTWQALGLTSDQVARVSALQGAYKAMMAPKEPAKATKGAKRNKARQPEPTHDAATAAAVSSARGTSDAMAATSTDPSVLDPNASLQGNASASQQPLSIDDQFRAILTPEQLALWERRCNERTSMAH